MIGGRAPLEVVPHGSQASPIEQQKDFGVTGSYGRRRGLAGSSSHGVSPLGEGSGDDSEIHVGNVRVGTNKGHPGGSFEDVQQITLVSDSQYAERDVREEARLRGCHQTQGRHKPVQDGSLAAGVRGRPRWRRSGASGGGGAKQEKKGRHFDGKSPRHPSSLIGRARGAKLGNCPSGA